MSITSAWMFAAAVLIAVSAWHLLRKQNIETMRTSLRFGMWFMIISFAGVAVTGDQLGLVMVATQPMKMAAAEALYDSACGADASFSLFSLGTPDGSRSEEHTSELQSLMSISYAVFCLKKNKNRI